MQYATVDLRRAEDFLAQHSVLRKCGTERQRDALLYDAVGAVERAAYNSRLSGQDGGWTRSKRSGSVRLSSSGSSDSTLSTRCNLSGTTSSQERGSGEVYEIAIFHAKRHRSIWNLRLELEGFHRLRERL